MSETAPAKEVFGSASELPPAQRGAFLDGACRGNPALRARVEALLRALDEGGSFLSDLTRAEPPREGSGAAGSAAAPLAHIAEGPGALVGRYKLLQQIGEGGFGVVFIAEQREPVVRRVALKIIKLGMDTRQVIARFEAERQALAMMDHPCIAKVLDAGATDTGRPFFVMELVHGDPITHYCDKNNLNPTERLELFVQVCQAVQHAHTKGIIHRDVKPSNVLVTMLDGRAVPKVIDFGVAKATSSRLTDKTIFTEFRQLVGTPEYMSPEQAEMSGVDIDTRTDIYSLGVLLYELLVGVTPFDGRKLRSAAWGELQRIIREEEPTKPSTRLSTMKDTLASVAAHRRTEPARLSKVLRGDLDWIVMKCLEKSRSRRYDTASGLAADVRRHLDGEPVLAAPPGAGYLVGKFMRRHRVGVGVTVALGAAMALGIIGTSIGLWQAAHANSRLDIALNRTKAQRDAATSALGAIARRFADEPALASPGQGQAEITLGELSVGTDEARAVEVLGQAATQLVEGLVQARRQAATEAEGARKEASKAHAVTDFLQQLLEGVFPEKARTNREVTVREIVDRSAKALKEGRTKLAPELEATVRGTLGKLYRALGEYKEAQHHLERAIELGETGALPKGEVAALRNDLGHTFRDLKDIDSANAAYQRALAEAIEADGPQSATAANAYNSLAGLAMLGNRLDEADGLFAKALEIMVASRGQDDVEVLQIISNQAVLADRRARPADAERLLAPLLERGQKVLGDDDPFVAETQINLGIGIAKQGRLDEALPLVRGAEQLTRKIFGDAHPQTVRALTQLGNVALFAGDPAEAERCYSAMLQVLRGRGEEEKGRILEALRGYSSALEFQGKPEVAEAPRRELLQVCRDGGPGRTPAELATQLANLGHNLGAQGRWSEVEPLLRECITIRRGVLKEGNPQFWSLRYAESLLGEAIAEQAAARAGSDPSGAAAAFAEAEGLIIPAAESVPGDPNVPKPLPRSPDRKRQTLERAVKLYVLWGKLGEDAGRAEKSTAWQQRLEMFGTQ